MAASFSGGGFAHPSAACQGSHADTAILLQASGPAWHLAHPPVWSRAIHEEPPPPGVPGMPARGQCSQQQLRGQAQEPPVHSPQRWQGCAVYSCSSCGGSAVSLGSDCSPATRSRSARLLCDSLRMASLRQGPVLGCCHSLGDKRVSADAHSSRSANDTYFSTGSLWKPSEPGREEC